APGASSEAPTESPENSVYTRMLRPSIDGGISSSRWSQATCTIRNACKVVNTCGALGLQGASSLAWMACAASDPRADIIARMSPAVISASLTARKRIAGFRAKVEEWPDAMPIAGVSQHWRVAPPPLTIQAANRVTLEGREGCALGY